MATLRERYHQEIGAEIVRASSDPQVHPNFADGSSRSSKEIAIHICSKLQFDSVDPRPGGQTAGSLFEKITCRYIERALTALKHLQPGEWAFRTEQTAISNFVQFQHLQVLDQMVSSNRSLATALGHGYVVTPDIVVLKKPLSDTQVNEQDGILDSTDEIATLTPWLIANQSDDLRMFLHASVSCKWTIRSDRSQNTRTEALNLIRNRKGRVPHILAVTAEPLPMRIASLALGTGDLDCVYHFALNELRDACEQLDRGEDQLEMLDTMIDGNRLRDISDLPFDLIG